MPSSSGRVKLSEYHRPPFDLNETSIPHLTPESRRCATTSESMFHFGGASIMRLSLHDMSVIQVYTEPCRVPASEVALPIPQIEDRSRSGCALCRADGRHIRSSQQVSMRVGVHFRAAPVRALTRLRTPTGTGRRASHLRTYAGDTVLPGGKWEPRDKSYEWTAVGILAVMVLGASRRADSSSRLCAETRGV